MQHYAFLISEDEFDAAFVQIQQSGIAYYADPHMKRQARSTTTMAGAGCTSWIRPATAWRSSPVPTAVIRRHRPLRQTPGKPSPGVGRRRI
jgi:hypothetical protein